MLPSSQKELILGFTETQNEEKDTFDDVIQGKGRGVSLAYIRAIHSGGSCDISRERAGALPEQITDKLRSDHSSVVWSTWSGQDTHSGVSQ